MKKSFLHHKKIINSLDGEIIFASQKKIHKFIGVEIIFVSQKKLLNHCSMKLCVHDTDITKLVYIIKLKYGFTG